LSCGNKNITVIERGLNKALILLYVFIVFMIICLKMVRIIYI